MVNPKPEFSTEYPTSQYPKLPEYFRPETISGILPGDIVFPYGGSAIKVDQSTGALYLVGRCDIDQEARQPASYSIRGYRVGVMRIYEEIDGVATEGFLADCRYLKPGSLSSESINLDESATEFDKRFTADSIQRQQLTPLLGVVFSDPDGNPHFSGDENLQAHVISLMEAVDSHVPPLPEDKATTEPVVEEPIFSSDYYHG